MPNSHKSGFTPIDYTFPSKISAARENEITAIEALQTHRFYGFTARELGQLDALCTRDLVPGNLKNGIVPFLRRENWEKVPYAHFSRKHLYPVEGGTGMWIADNDEVWKVLEPCVRLASRILLSVELLPWVRIFSSGQLSADMCNGLMLLCMETDAGYRITA